MPVGLAPAGLARLAHPQGELAAARAAGAAGTVFCVSTGSSYSQIAFSGALGPDQLVIGVVLALALGLIGGLAPAIRAACTPILKLAA